MPLTDLLSVTYRDFGDGDGVVDLEAEVAGDLREEPGAIGHVADEGVIDGRTRGRRFRDRHDVRLAARLLIRVECPLRDGLHPGWA